MLCWPYWWIGAILFFIYHYCRISIQAILLKKVAQIMWVENYLVQDFIPIQIDLNIFKRKLTFAVRLGDDFFVASCLLSKWKISRCVVIYSSNIKNSCRAVHYQQDIKTAYLTECHFSVGRGEFETVGARFTRDRLASLITPFLSLNILKFKSHSSCA